MGAGSLGSAADLPTECASAESYAVPADCLCAHIVHLHHGIEVGTRPAHICFTGNGSASETQSIRLTTSQSAFSATWSSPRPQASRRTDAKCPAFQLSRRTTWNEIQLLRSAVAASWSVGMGQTASTQSVRSNSKEPSAVNRRVVGSSPT